MNIQEAKETAKKDIAPAVVCCVCGELLKDGSVHRISHGYCWDCAVSEGWNPGHFTLTQERGEKAAIGYVIDEGDKITIYRTSHNVLKDRLAKLTSR